jgi:50S ribosomal protein L16 3-hydroxylase
MNTNPLAAFGIERFLRECWQKKPLVLRGVAPELAGALGRAGLIELACRDDVESRLVLRSGHRWEVRHGPFRRRDFAALPARNWTLLVNGVDTLVPAARALQTAFGFIPWARHDDVMVSYAAPGGGVGPHFDSYDVFLLQGAGRRRWQISRQRDLSLIDGAPLRILSRFRAQRDLLMHSGDLLYLPPSYAHHGVAEGECLTWSVGMRAPNQREVVSRFLDYLQDTLTADAVYRDAGLKRQVHAAEIAPLMRNRLRRMIRTLRWTNADIDRCMGELLSEPRQNAVFTPQRATAAATFARRLRACGMHLDPKSRLLFIGRTYFMNGARVDAKTGDAALLRRFADKRALPAGARASKSALSLLHDWYRSGFVGFGDGSGNTPRR